MVQWSPCAGDYGNNRDVRRVLKSSGAPHETGECMQVQVNHDNHLRIGEEVADRLTRVLESSLSQFADRITRIEMHLGDENAGKAGASDKRCMLEARLANLEPIAVTHQAESLQLAFEGALEKLDRALGNAIGKLQTH